MPERHASPALRHFPPGLLHVVPLAGVEADIYNSLWRAIIEGKLKPGVKLREEAIGEVFGVSRTITRKVLFIMEQEGSVSLPANRGAYVATPSTDDVPLVFEALGMAMAHTIRTLSDPAMTISPEHKRLLDEHLAAQEAADTAQDVILSQLIGTDFPVLLAAIHGNPVITELTARMLIRQALIMTVFRQYPMPPERADMQRAIVAAILDHRTEDALAGFRARHSALHRNLRLDGAGEEVDLATLLRETARTGR